MATHTWTCGDWVEFVPLAAQDVLTGYILDLPTDTNVCKVYVPSQRKVFIVRREQLDASPQMLHLADIPALIDLSLDLRDEIWFEQLVSFEPHQCVNGDFRFLWIFLPLLSVFLFFV